jgi:hypothetical protein
MVEKKLGRKKIVEKPPPEANLGCATGVPAAVASNRGRSERMATRPLVCKIPIIILHLFFMQRSLARPDFDRAGSEFLRRRAPVSRLESMRYKSSFIYFYTHVPHVSSTIGEKE